MTDAQQQQLEDWNKVKKKALQATGDRAALADYEWAEERRLRGE